MSATLLSLKLPSNTWLPAQIESWLRRQQVTCRYLTLNFQLQLTALDFVLKVVSFLQFTMPMFG